MVACIGLAVSLEIVYVHGRISALGKEYTSFCNVNDTINCDRVLGSPFSKLFGIPVGWFALATYAFLAAAFWTARNRIGEAAAANLTLAGLGVAGAGAFSVYMAGISYFEVHAVCLLCSGLYAVAATLVGLMIAIIAAFRTAWPRLGPMVSIGGFAGALVFSGLAVAGLAWATWPSVATLDASLVTLEDVRKADPDFYTWYTNHRVVDPGVADRNAIGAAGAAVTIVEYADLQCGHCRKSHEKLKGLLERRPDEIRLVYRHFPLDVACNEAVKQTIHRFACRAAEAAECSALQGRFAEMLDRLFAKQNVLFDTTIMRIATDLGLDMEKFAGCMASGEMRKHITEDSRWGKKLEIKSTPTLFFNGREIKGSFDADANYDYAVLIEAGLAAAGAGTEAAATTAVVDN